MVRRLGAIGLVLMFCGGPAAAAKVRLVCNDGKVVKAHGKACKHHGGVSAISAKNSVTVVPTR